MNDRIAILEHKNKQLEQQTQYLQTELECAHQKYEDLIQKLRAAGRKQFGSISERFVDSDQLPMFDILDTQDTESVEYEPIAYERKKTKKGGKPKDPPTREVIIELEDKTCECGHERVVIDYETKHLLHHIPAQIEVIVQKREVVACNRCNKGIETAPLPKHILPKCKATESLLAHIAVSKILDRQPLYHLEKVFQRDFDWHIKRATMSRWLIQLADALRPLVNAIKDQLYEYDIASADATSIQVLKTPTKKPQSKSMAYCIRGGPPGAEVVIFEYLDLLQSEYLDETFSPFKGTLMVDGANCFDQLAQKYPITLANCHAHSRRKFEAIYKANKKKGALAKHALQVYNELYKIERYARDSNLSPDQLHQLRHDKTKPLLENFKSWLLDYKDKTPPKSPIHKAMAYTLKYWDGLTVFLNDPRIEPDNNATEREIKTFVLARKNFLFCDTQFGADALGTLFTVLLTAKKHGLNPRSYFESVLKKAPHCDSLDDWQLLLPWNFKAV